MHQRSRPRIAARVASVATTCALLAACGGGSSGTTTTVASASASASATTTSAVTLTSTTMTQSTLGKAKAYAELYRYALCMRAHGVDLPPPNLTGTGPLFELGKINPYSKHYQAATRACHYTIVGIVGP